MKLRRKMLTILAGAVLAAQAGAALAQGAPTEIKVLGFGGKLDSIFAQALGEFEATHKVKFRFIPGSPPDNAAKLVATAARPEYDMSLFDNLYFNLASSKGVLAKVDDKIATNYKDLDPRAVPPSRDGYTVGFYFTGLMYNTNEFSKRKWAAPTSWQDIFNPQYCNLIGLGTVMGSFGLNTLVMLAGGNLDRIQQSMDQVAKLKNCVAVLESNSAKLEERTQTGEHVIAVAVSTRVPTLMRQGYPVRFLIPKEGTVIGNGTMGVVKGGANERIAHEAANWLQGPKAQKILMDEAFYMPANAKVPLSKDLVNYGFPTAEMLAKSVTIDGNKVVDMRRDWKRYEDRVMQR